MHNDKRKLVVAYQYFFLGESQGGIGNEKKGFSEKHHRAEQLKLYLFHHTSSTTIIMKKNVFVSSSLHQRV